MKKFMKVGLIAGFLLILAGTGAAAAAFALGADVWRISDFLEEKFDRWDYGPYNDWQHDDWYYEENWIPEEDIASEQAEFMPDSAESPDSENPAPENMEELQEPEPYAENTDGGFHASYTDISRLEIRQNGGNVAVYVQEGIEELTVSSPDGSLSSIAYEGRGDFQKLTLRVYEDENYEILIPAAWILGGLEVETDRGNFIGEGIRAVEANIQAEGDSLLHISQAEVEFLELESDDSNIEWRVAGEGPVSAEVESERSEIRIFLPEELDTGRIGYTVHMRDSYVELPDHGSFSGAMVEKRLPAREDQQAFYELSAKSGSIVIEK